MWRLLLSVMTTTRLLFYELLMWEGIQLSIIMVDLYCLNWKLIILKFIILVKSAKVDKLQVSKIYAR